MGVRSQLCNILLGLPLHGIRSTHSTFLSVDEVSPSAQCTVYIACCKPLLGWGEGGSLVFVCAVPCSMRIELS